MSSSGSSSGSSSRAATRGAIRTAAYAVASCLLAAVAALAVGPAGPAAAAVAAETHRDPGRDVLSGPFYTDDLPTRPEPGRRLGDITRTTVTLGADLVVTTRFRSLAAVGHQEFSWFVATSEDDFYWTASLVVQPGDDKGKFSLIDPDANQPGCGRAVLDRPGRRAVLTIPAQCLGDPSWVRVANGVMVFVGESRIYYDDARRDGAVRHGWKYGPKVTAGQ